MNCAAGPTLRTGAAGSQGESRCGAIHRGNVRVNYARLKGRREGGRQGTFYNTTAKSLRLASVRMAHAENPKTSPRAAPRA
jgi:hypothetical protein